MNIAVKATAPASAIRYLPASENAPDPIFALIEHHRSLYSAYSAACEVAEMDTTEADELGTQVANLEIVMANTVPASLAGVVAIMAYARAYQPIATVPLFPDDCDATLPGHGVSNWLLSLERAAARLGGLPEPVGSAGTRSDYDAPAVDLGDFGRHPGASIVTGKVGGCPDIADLPFVKDRPEGGRCFWSVKSTGNYTADYAQGAAWGRLLLPFFPYNLGPVLLTWVVADMADVGAQICGSAVTQARHSENRGLVLGFMRAIGEEFARGHAMLAAAHAFADSSASEEQLTEALQQMLAIARNMPRAA